MKTMNRLFLALFLCTSLAACGAGEIGEACDTVGSEDDCVDGAICTNESGDVNTCRKLCEEDTDCADVGGGCNGISSTNLKSCQP